MEFVIQTEGLTKIFFKNKLVKKEETRAVVNLDLQVASGEVFGFLGPNGAGKSTTIKMLLRLLFPTSGKAWLFGTPIERPEARRKVGFLPENPYFYDYLTAAEFLFLNGRLYGMSRTELKSRVDELIEFVGLEEHRDSRLRKFSKGMLQRIGLAQALVNDPELVILDEPTSGLDPLGRKMVLDLILKLKEQGKTVFFSTHILPDAEVVCDSVGIIINGELRKSGKLSDLLGKTKGYQIEFTGITDQKILKRIERLSKSQIEINEDVMTVEASEDELYNIVEIIRIGDGKLLRITPQKRTLEDVFIEEVKEA